MVLSGEGGDELFLGYPTVHAANAARFYRMLPGVLRSAMKIAARRLPAGTSRLPLSFKIKSFVEADHPDIFRTFFGFKEVVRYQTWPELLTPEALAMVGEIDPFVAFTQYREKLEHWHLIDALSYLDLKVFLPGSCFYGTDNAFMAASVECRVPFMDNELVDFAAALPVNVRFHPWKVKHLLRHALERHFPTPRLEKEKLPRYRKNGFEVPGTIWLKSGRFHDMLQRLLSEKRIARAGFFKSKPVQTLIEEQLSGKQNNERILQAIMSLNLFLEGTYSLD